MSASTAESKATGTTSMSQHKDSQTKNESNRGLNMKVSPAESKAAGTIMMNQHKDSQTKNEACRSLKMNVSPAESKSMGTLMMAQHNDRQTKNEANTSLKMNVSLAESNATGSIMTTQHNDSQTKNEASQMKNEASRSVKMNVSPVESKVSGTIMMNQHKDIQTQNEASRSRKMNLSPAKSMATGTNLMNQQKDSQAKNEANRSLKMNVSTAENIATGSIFMNQHKSSQSKNEASRSWKMNISPAESKANGTIMMNQHNGSQTKNEANRSNRKRNTLWIWFLTFSILTILFNFTMVPNGNSTTFQQKRIILSDSTTVTPMKQQGSNQQELTQKISKSRSNIVPSSIKQQRQQDVIHNFVDRIPKESCALCFFGLPRSFQLLVLPSIVKNVLIPNKVNGCDMYFHFYDIEQESSGRSGYGGNINAHDVYLLQDKLYELYNYTNKTTNSHMSMKEPPHLSFTMDTDQEFWTKRKELLEKYRTVKGSDGKYLYFPWMAKTFVYPTSMDNIVKQWHSIESVWNDMERHQQLLQKNYTRVAMLRNDVVYVTPFDIYKLDDQNNIYDKQNQYAVVPNWARFPINDRMIYGPYQAVKIWSTERFTRLEDHVLTYEPGYGMHSERFLNHSIFPAIRELGIEVYQNPDICFFRARSDGSTWISDCSTRDGAARGFRQIDKHRLVESIIGRTCRRSKFRARTIQLRCNDEQEDGN